MQIPFWTLQPASLALKGATCPVDPGPCSLVHREFRYYVKIFLMHEGPSPIPSLDRPLENIREHTAARSLSDVCLMRSGPENAPKMPLQKMCVSCIVHWFLELDALKMFFSRCGRTPSCYNGKPPSRGLEMHTLS